MKAFTGQLDLSSRAFDPAIDTFHAPVVDGRDWEEVLAVGQTLCGIGRAMASFGHSDSAADWMKDGTALIHRYRRKSTVLLGGQDPAQQFLRNAHWDRGRVLVSASRHDEAIDDLKWAAALCGPVAPEKLQFELLDAQIRGGQPNEAAEVLTQLAARPTADWAAAELVDLARLYAAAAADTSPLTWRMRMLLADRAVVLLRAAVAGDPKNGKFLELDPSFDPLRDRADFRSLIEAANR